MKVLVTTSQSLLLVDTESGEYRSLDRDRGPYFGMSCHNDVLYAVARNGGNDGGLDMILMLDSKLALCGTIDMPGRHNDIHEIAWCNDQLWVTFTAANAVGILSDGRWEWWHPQGEQEKDIFHFNSFLFESDRVWVLAHNYGDSELFAFSYEDKRLLERRKVGVCAHNIRRVGEELLLCSSREGLLLGTCGFRLSTGGWPRGLLVADGVRCVGISELSHRSERGLTTGAVQVYDGSWRLQKTITFPGEGNVHEVLLLPPAFIGRLT